MGMFRSSCCSGQGTHAASSQPACRVRNWSCFTRILLLDTMVMVSIFLILAVGVLFGTLALMIPGAIFLTLISAGLHNLNTP